MTGIAEETPSQIQSAASTLENVAEYAGGPRTTSAAAEPLRVTYATLKDDLTDSEYSYTEEYSRTEDEAESSASPPEKSSYAQVLASARQALKQL